MITPFDAVVESIATARYHNHRLEGHSDLISDGFVADLVEACPAFRQDLADDRVRIWRNVASPGDRQRKVDLFIGEPGRGGEPDVAKLRLAVENKSVITAHRNRTNRFDDLQKILKALHGARPQALIIATVLVGVSRRVLNVPDKLMMFYRETKMAEFEERVLPRLSSGDESLLSEFSWAVSKNSSNDAAATFDLMRTLPVREPAHTHIEAFDSVLLVPVEVDNVHPPRVARKNELGLDVDQEYRECIRRTCSAYTARWHI